MDLFIRLSRWYCHFPFSRRLFSLIFCKQSFISLFDWPDCFIASEPIIFIYQRNLEPLVNVSFAAEILKSKKQENRSGHNFGMTFRKCCSKVHNSQFFLLYTWDVCSEIDRRQLIFLGLCDWFHSRPNKETKEKIQSNFQFPIFVIDRFHDLTPTFISEGFSLAFFGPLFICILPARRYY